VEAIATVDSFQADFVDVNVVGVFVGFMAISFDEESAGFLIEGFDVCIEALLNQRSYFATACVGDIDVDLLEVMAGAVEVAFSR